MDRKPSIKPKTIAEMLPGLTGLRVQSPKRHAATTSKKVNWNSSVKIARTVSHTVNGKIKHNPVRKMLNFQPKPKPVTNIREEHRNYQEHINHSSELESSADCHENFNKSFEKPTDSKEDTKIENSAIVSLYDLLEKQTEHSLKIIENSINALNEIKKAELTSLQYVRNLINEKKPCETVVDKTLTNTKVTTKLKQTDKFSPEREAVVSEQCSVIKSCTKSPSYKIPKKNLCLRKKVYYKSMANVSNEPITPVKIDMGDKALSMYMNMKEHMNFLSTPAAKQEFRVPDTPAVTSLNLQKQLDRLYEYDEN